MYAKGDVLARQSRCLTAKLQFLELNKDQKLLVTNTLSIKSKQIMREKNHDQIKIQTLYQILLQQHQNRAF